jgi:hypothetical protein
MKRLIIAMLFSSLPILPMSVAFAQTTCKAQAVEKKLAGAAMTSFIKRCEKDAAASCDSAAKQKKLSGAASTSFTKKCVKDAVGS